MKGVQLSKMVQELNLHNKTPDVDISKKRITLPDILPDCIIKKIIVL